MCLKYLRVSEPECFGLVPVAVGSPAGLGPAGPPWRAVRRTGAGPGTERLDAGAWPGRGPRAARWPWELD